MNRSSERIRQQGKSSAEESTLINKRDEWEDNPDLEDPRLYSPLQEPDTPSPHERILEKLKQKKTPSSVNRVTLFI